MTPLSLALGGLGLTDQGGTPPFLLATPGNYGALGGISSFTRADAATCATFWDVNGVLQTVAAGVLRDSAYVGALITSKAKTVLLEAAATNLNFFGSDLGNAGGWVNTRATGALTGTGPDGVANSCTNWTEDNTAGATHRADGAFTVAITASATFAFAALVHAQGRSAFRLYATGATSQFEIHADLVAKSVTTTVTGTAVISLSRVTEMGNGWFLVEAAGQVEAGRAAVQMVCMPESPSGTSAYDGNGTLSLRIAYVHTESNVSFPSSSLKTPTNATVTRAADALVLGGSSQFAAATLFLHFYDLATATWTDVVSGYTAGTTITPATGRAYSHIAVCKGAGLSAAQCKALIGGSFPA